MKRTSFFNKELPKKLSPESVKRAEEFDKRESGIDYEKNKANHKQLTASMEMKRIEQENNQENNLECESEERQLSCK
ncbi:hypothetical protein Lsan_1432 [Legionella santicrucis]|uniref:Uncharacterized protein n=1 Tax=Legionella santicrucis TaxID=45074 RepID=A0A0W0Z2J8_9GAMM|nr:hypothetical protein [Legionella santicrucis]KTD63314.1 hypothetical protein Lsan_1432 [Legionella santicrucis]